MGIVLVVCAGVLVVLVVTVVVMFRRTMLSLNDELIAALAMTPDEFYAARQAGRSVEDLALERDTDTEQIVASFLTGSPHWWLRWVASATGTGP